MKTILFYIVIIYFILNPSILHSQNQKDLTYPSGFCSVLDLAKIQKLKKLMGVENPDWGAVQKCYFNDIYDPELPDLICYIKKDSAKIGLVKGNKIVTELFGERFIWVMIFSEYELNSGKNSKDSATVDLNVLAYEHEPSESIILSILKTISSFIFSSNVGIELQKQAFKDSTININLSKNQYNGDSLYTWMGKIKIGLNTKNRIVIRPPDSHEEKNFLFIYHNFGNFEKSFFGVSLGVGSTIAKELTDSNRVNLFVYGHYYLYRSTLPVDNKSLSLVLGTNFITGTFLHNIILGLRCGIFNPGGIIAGVNWVLLPDNVRRIRLFFGLDYRL
jgi:hypothetical protein